MSDKMSGKEITEFVYDTIMNNETLYTLLQEKMNKQFFKGYVLLRRNFKDIIDAAKAQAKCLDNTIDLRKFSYKEMYDLLDIEYGNIKDFHELQRFVSQ